MITAATGHRPEKIGGYDFYAPQRAWVRAQIKRALIDLKTTRGISGMALGVDQDFAYVCIELAIPFTAAIPFVGQEDAWPPHAQEWYEWLLIRAADVVVVSPGEYTAAKMQVRNEWMVDNCDVLLAVWDGSKGGTGNCVNYAYYTYGHSFIYRINPNDYFEDRP